MFSRKQDRTSSNRKGKNTTSHNGTSEEISFVNFNGSGGTNCPVLEQSPPLSRTASPISSSSSSQSSSPLSSVVSSDEDTGLITDQIMVSQPSVDKPLPVFAATEEVAAKSAANQMYKCLLAKQVNLSNLKISGEEISDRTAAHIVIEALEVLAWLLENRSPRVMESMSTSNCRESKDIPQPSFIFLHYDNELFQAMLKLIEAASSSGLLNNSDRSYPVMLQSKTSLIKGSAKKQPVQSNVVNLVPRMNNDSFLPLYNPEDVTINKNTLLLKGAVLYFPLCPDRYHYELPDKCELNTKELQRSLLKYALAGVKKVVLYLGVYENVLLQTKEDCVVAGQKIWSVWQEANQWVKNPKEELARFAQQSDKLTLLSSHFSIAVVKHDSFLASEPFRLAKEVLSSILNTHVNCGKSFIDSVIQDGVNYITTKVKKIVKQKSEEQKLEEQKLEEQQPLTAPVVKSGLFKSKQSPRSLSSPSSPSISPSPVFISSDARRLAGKTQVALLQRVFEEPRSEEKIAKLGRNFSRFWQEPVLNNIDQGCGKKDMDNIISVVTQNVLEGEGIALLIAGAEEDSLLKGYARSLVLLTLSTQEVQLVGLEHENNVNPSRPSL